MTEGEAEAKSLVFSVNKNLQVHVRIVHCEFVICKLTGFFLEREYLRILTACEGTLNNANRLQEDVANVDRFAVDCCVNRLCWCYVSNGLCTVSQDEVVIILESFPDEQAVPRDVFVHYQHIYEEAAKGVYIIHIYILSVLCSLSFRRVQTL